MSALPSLVEQLRDACWPAHRDLDHHPLLAPLTAKRLALTDYARALAALYAPQAAFEEALKGFAPPELSPRLPDLAADLAELKIAPWPLAAPLPSLEDSAAKLGALYVLEGANLGGAFIARRLAENLPPAVPRRFFGHAGGQERWARVWRFAASLGQLEAEPIVSAALATFACFRAHLDACSNAPSGECAALPSTPLGTKLG